MWKNVERGGRKLFLDGGDIGVRKFEPRFRDVHHRGQDLPELQQESSMRLAQTISPSYTRLDR